MDPVGFTARMTAAARARETERPDRLFSDPFASALAGPEGLAFLERHDATFGGGPQQNFAVRTRFYDERLLEATRDSPVRQVVLPAAGLDTRAFRLDWPPGVDLYELDQAEVLTYKESVLSPLGADLRCNRRTIAVDLRDPWTKALVAAGYRSGESTIWLAEGFLFYLPEAAVKQLLEDAASLSIAGSRFYADLPTQTFLRSPAAESFVALYTAMGAPFQFSTDEPEAVFRQHGWTAEVLRTDEQGIRLGRPLGPVPPVGPPRGILIDAQRV
jgi:methyltransferase (TIGR00027 family)